MYHKIYRITIVVITLLLVVYIIPFLFNGILVESQTNSGPQLKIINLYGRINFNQHGKKIGKSGLYTLHPLDSSKGPMKSGHYITYGSVTGIRKSDGDSYYCVYNVRGILPVNMFIGLTAALGLMIIVTIFLFRGVFFRKKIRGSK
jgi:hypothetical protein